MDDVGAGHVQAQHQETWGLQALDVVTKAIASSSASRQVAAAMIAAAIRTLSDCTRPTTPSCKVTKLVEELVEDRCTLLRPVLEAQTVAGLLSGLDQHSSRVLVSTQQHLAANFARHHGFNSCEPVSTLGSAKMKRLQRHRSFIKEIAKDVPGAEFAAGSVQPVVDILGPQETEA